MIEKVDRTRKKKFLMAERVNQIHITMLATRHTSVLKTRGTMRKVTQNRRSMRPTMQDQKTMGLLLLPQNLDTAETIDTGREREDLELKRKQVSSTPRRLDTQDHRTTGLVLSPQNLGTVEPIGTGREREVLELRRRQTSSTRRLLESLHPARVIAEPTKAELDPAKTNTGATVAMTQ